MSQKLKVIFADFLRAARQLWLECIGGIFLGLGILFGLAAIQEYRRLLNNHPGLDMAAAIETRIRLLEQRTR